MDGKLKIHRNSDFFVSLSPGGDEMKELRERKRLFDKE
jgi:hypothetical protein